MKSVVKPSAEFRFKKATGTDNSPCGYQKRLACGEQAEGQADADWLSQSGSCESRLISIPTGLGKTAAVVLAWLWNRVHLQSGKWPRRLVYCLPIRTLVEQTRDEAKKWIDALFDAGLITSKPRVVVLMGGENLEPEAKDWDIHPEAPASNHRPSES